MNTYLKFRECVYFGEGNKLSICDFFESAAKYKYRHDVYTIIDRKQHSIILIILKQYSKNIPSLTNVEFS